MPSALSFSSQQPTKVKCERWQAYTCVFVNRRRIVIFNENCTCIMATSSPSSSTYQSIMMQSLETIQVPLNNLEQSRTKDNRQHKLCNFESESRSRLLGLGLGLSL